MSIESDRPSKYNVLIQNVSMLEIIFNTYCIIIIVINRVVIASGFVIVNGVDDLFIIKKTKANKMMDAKASE